MTRRAARGSSGFPMEDHDHDRCVDAALEKAEVLCSARGARLTALRREVLSILWSSHAPMGAYDVLAKLNEDGRRAAPMTVYRAIDFLMEQGLVHRLASRNAFVGCENPDAPHSGQFLICKRCGRVAELDEGDIGKAIVRSAARAGFDVAIPVVEVEGFCPDCHHSGVGTAVDHVRRS